MKQFRRIKSSPPQPRVPYLGRPRATARPPLSTPFRAPSSSSEIELVESVSLSLLVGWNLECVPDASLFRRLFAVASSSSLSSRDELADLARFMSEDRFRGGRDSDASDFGTGAETED